MLKIAVAAVGERGGEGTEKVVVEKKRKNKTIKWRRKRAVVENERGVRDRIGGNSRGGGSLVRRTALAAYDLRVTRFSARESAREGKGRRIVDKEDERDGRRERLYHVVRGSGGIAGSRVAAVVASLSSSTTRNASAGGANIGRKEGRANGLYACNSASRAGRERSERECVREKEKDR